ncbi:MAG: hypothetical protein Q9219_004323 [cf. Caloplaca sp. 3 TL-2023]
MRQKDVVVWLQPRPRDPTPFMAFCSERFRKRRDQGLEPNSSTEDYNAWHSLTLDERKTYWHEKRQEDFEAAMAKFNDGIPLSPLIPGKRRSRDGDGEIGGKVYKRSLQNWNRYRKDYRSASSNDTTSEITEPFPFLRLLPEIRRMVYTLTVKRKQPVLHLAADGSALHPGGPIDLRIALASKQLFTEVMATFFEINVIEVMIHPYPSVGLPLLFYPTAVSAAYWPFEGLRRLDLCISFDKVEEGNFVRAELEKFCHVVQRCQLSRLRVKATCDPKWFRDGIDESFDQVLQSLERLRGVQELIFTTDLGMNEEEAQSHQSSRLVGTQEYRDRLRGIITQSQDHASN